ncbi:hypothetical protein STRAU_5253 [Streptomyces aurantiacus JA 4570]|uniref:Uncharacterized protein n=1 Tax=Streptomyces aurantiacus JA 4570 TaxID=1286094 RepID=S3ZEV0_9ACTN|nr:hypothetical protein STRAU_5253 [Streptomyces aurantiacus JA 4570]
MSGHPRGRAGPACTFLRARRAGCGPQPCFAVRRAAVGAPRTRFRGARPTRSDTPPRPSRPVP